MAHPATTDLLVVGCGIAGLSAAVSALQEGRSVTLLERSDPADFGGNTRWTEAYMRMKNDSEIADDFEEAFARNSGWNLDPNLVVEAAGPSAHWPAWVRAHPFPDPELIARFADQAPPTIAWLKSFGLRFEPQPIYLLTQNTARIAAQGGGLALIERLMQEAVTLGAQVLYRTTAIDLLRDEAGAVQGVLATGPDGKRQRIAARATVLASGGYEGNPEMLTHYLGATRARHIRPVARGGYYNRGEGIRMALAAGAAPAGEYGSYHAEPVDPRSRLPEAVIFIWPYGVLLNRHGRRFIDEAEGTADATYDNVTRAIADQMDGIAWVIFDGRVDDIPQWRRSIRSDIPPLEAPTLGGLLAQLDGLDSAAATETIAAYNLACAEDQPYEPLRLDGNAAAMLAPPKSNWARRIERPPFRAFPIVSANCFTFGGLKVNTDAQVLDMDGRVIAGLYAAGETVGIYNNVYVGSTSVLRGAVFGRLAGLHAARTT
ncbi:FAD-dependent oxidoreductase [Plastoroseomonas hellenica]|uniref:FAD-dependent oxidoreductase n=1 Tax=Plastoroseomonas hellenica TaxID=2687306 RepID=UPI001BACAB16|nr:FAD-dependent oxidoreductase [Plastoroseomonas hellenica]MBR0643032.1 FAD-dependent oxidoreductase [Plastoroseomonas hellenica]